MGFHPLRDDCACFRCVWRAHFVHWWQALPTKGAACTCTAFDCSTMGDDSSSTRQSSTDGSVSPGGASFADSCLVPRSTSSSPILSRKPPTAAVLEEEIDDTHTSLQRKRTRSSSPPVLVQETFQQPCVQDSFVAGGEPCAQHASQPVLTQDLGNVRTGRAPLSCHCMFIPMPVTARSFQSRWHDDSDVLLGSCHLYNRLAISDASEVGG